MIEVSLLVFFMHLYFVSSGVKVWIRYHDNAIPDNYFTRKTGFPMSLSKASDCAGRENGGYNSQLECHQALGVVNRVIGMTPTHHTIFDDRSLLATASLLSVPRRYCKHLLGALYLPRSLLGSGPLHGGTGQPQSNPRPIALGRPSPHVQTWTPLERTL